MAPPTLPGARTVRVGLIGHGTVGGAFATALRDAADLLYRRLGVDVALAQVAVRSPDRHREQLAGIRVHDDPVALVSDPSLDLVVEASGAHDAAQWIARALDRGLPVVTANKLALASSYPLLTALARRHPLLHCEAAVAAALPIVRALRESLDGEEVREVRGVLNGTTTFILSEIEKGATFRAAVSRATLYGYAEADAATDLSGEDAAAKLALLSTLVWRRPVVRESVRRQGIDGGIVERVLAARRKGLVVRLVAHAFETTDGALSLDVRPEVLDHRDPLARTEDVINAVQLQCALAGPLAWYGAGAGGEHSASALLNDLCYAVRMLQRALHGRIAA